MAEEEEFGDLEAYESEEEEVDEGEKQAEQKK